MRWIPWISFEGWTFYIQKSLKRIELCRYWLLWRCYVYTFWNSTWPLAKPPRYGLFPSEHVIAVQVLTKWIVSVSYKTNLRDQPSKVPSLSTSFCWHKKSHRCILETTWVSNVKSCFRFSLSVFSLLMTQLSDLRQWHHNWETQSDQDMDGVPGQSNAFGHPCRLFGAGHSTRAPKGKMFDLNAACLSTNSWNFKGACLSPYGYSVLSTWDSTGPYMIYNVRIFFNLPSRLIHQVGTGMYMIKPHPWEVCHPNLLRTLLRTTSERLKSKGTHHGIPHRLIRIVKLSWPWCLHGMNMRAPRRQAVLKLSPSQRQPGRILLVDLRQLSIT